MENEKETTQETATEKSNPSMVEGAFKAAEALKMENLRMEQNIAKLQELKAFEVLGGRTDGRPQETKPVELTPQEYSRLVLAGKLPLK